MSLGWPDSCGACPLYTHSTLSLFGLFIILEAF